MGEAHWPICRWLKYASQNYDSCNAERFFNDTLGTPLEEVVNDFSD